MIPDNQHTTVDHDSDGRLVQETSSGISNEVPESSLRMILVMSTIGLVASILLVATYRVTLPYVEANRQAYLEAAIFDVLPGAVRQQTFTLAEGDVLVPLEDEKARGLRLYGGYDEVGAFVGVAIEAQGQGFQDVLRILIGYVPGCECVVGMKVLESKETPGLGDKIEKDPAFLKNFDELDVRLSPDGEELLNRVGFVKKGSPREAWEVEGITGATVSSRAIATIIDDAASDLLPLIRANLNRLQQTESPSSSPSLQ